MRLLKKDSFIKDILILLLVGITVSALFAAGFALVTDKYFGKTVTGIMGDYGQYDLLFQGKVELKGALERQIREVMKEHFPGATLKSGISAMGKTTFFLSFPSSFKTKYVYENLGYYFNNLPGNGNFTIMTEPRINISSIPGGAFELLSNEVAKISGVSFTFRDGNSIGIILKNMQYSEAVQKDIKKVINRYQILEVRVNSGYSPEELVNLGKKVSQSLLEVPGVDYARDLSLSDGTNDYQYMINTLTQVKKFLLAYAAEVKIAPEAGQQLEVGDLLAVNGKDGAATRENILKPMDVVIKVTAKDADGIRGLIVQGDSEYLKDNNAYKLETGDKIGIRVATVEVSSRKTQLVYAMDQGTNLLKQVQSALEGYAKATGSPDLTVDGIQKITGQLGNVQKALHVVEANVTGLNGKVNRGSVAGMINLINGAGDDLDYLAKTFGRIRILEDRFDQALTGFGTARSLVGSPLIQNAMNFSGGIFDKVRLLDSQLGIVESSLRERVRQLDDFVNRFNPLVAVLLSWRNKARDFATQVDNFSTTFTPGSENHQKLTELVNATDQVAATLNGVDLEKIQSSLGLASDKAFGAEKIDLNALVTELERMKESLPKLLDEEIGNTVNLIDQYAGGETATGDKIQVFTKSGIDQGVVETVISGALNHAQAQVFSLPAGTIQPDVRNEVYKILAQVRSTIAALMVVVLWIFSFILDQSLIVAMLKQMNLQWLPLKWEPENPLLKKTGNLIQKLLNPANLYAAAVGGVWLGVTFKLSGATVPYLNFWHLGLIGAIFGMLLAVMAEKINPVNKEEVFAGLSLGLPFRTIMREIVIPAGRPGLMQMLNRRKMIMK
ncbi:MAG TPA: hypothetical protein VEC37_02590 [Bacillota bacterium]|nr:hypothetical protein [Bacillota bacterium]